MIDRDLEVKVLTNICALKDKGYQVVIVHGGGPFIKKALKEANIESEFIDGHRKTTPEAYAHVSAALRCRVNASLVNRINTLGYKAVGLSGIDGKTVIATKRMHRKMIDGELSNVDLGQVGDVAKVNPSLIQILLNNDFIPVMTCLAADKSGEEYNINADLFAGHIAGALKAGMYVVLTDVDGLLREKGDPSSLIREIDLAGTNQLLKDNIIQGGMIPKIESCEVAINTGAQSARIINGTVPEQIITLAQNRPVGTIVHK